jgi:hypothetical protein
VNEKNSRICLTPSRTATHPTTTRERIRLRLRGSSYIVYPITGGYTAPPAGFARARQNAATGWLDQLSPPAS